MSIQQQQDNEEQRRQAESCADCIAVNGWPCKTTLAGYPRIYLGCRREAMAGYADARPSLSYHHSMDRAVDGRALWIGSTPYDEDCAPKEPK